MARPDMISLRRTGISEKRYRANAVFQICVRFSFLFFTAGLVVLLFAVPIMAAQVTLAWDSNTESDLAGYRIYYGNASRNYTMFIDVGKVNTYTVTGLTDGNIYYFAATAYSTSNVESAYSVEVNHRTCSYSISPPSASVTQQGATGTVQVTTQAGCPWVASSGAPWVTITSGNQGTGNGTASYSVSANTGATARTATSTIAGKLFTINQAGTGSTYYNITASAGTGGTISPPGTVNKSAGTSQTFFITPGPGYAISSVVVDGTPVGAITSYTFNNIAANHTIAASFVSSVPVSSSTYTITASAETGGTISPSGAVAVSRGASKSFTISPSQNYDIYTVYVDGSWKGPISSYTFTGISANHTINAKFTLKTFTITASAGKGGTISPSGSVSVPYGYGKYFSVRPNTGYKVSRVLVNGVSKGAVTYYRFDNVTKNHRISAEFVKK